MRAIQAATRDAARIARRSPDFGVLSAGYAADVLVVDGDPLQDLQRLREPAMVIKGGRFVAGSMPT